MIVLVYEDFKTINKSILGALKERVPKSATMYSSGDNIDSIVTSLSTKPIMSEKWLVIVTVRELKKPLLRLANYDALVVFLFRRKGDFDTALETVNTEGIQCSAINNMLVSKETMLAYVETEANVPADIAKFICYRHNFYQQKVMETVEFINLTGIRDKKAISEYTRASNSITYQEVFDYIIGVRKEAFIRRNLERKVTPKKVYSFLYEYRFGYKHLLKYIVKRMELYLIVFNEAIVGNLSLENYSDYKRTVESLEKQPDYLIKRALQDMQWISLDHLFLLSALYEKELDNGSLFSFINTVSLSDNI